MRKVDLEKDNAEKALKTINFDVLVLRKLEELAVKNNTKVSVIVNMLCRQVVLSDAAYFKEMSKYHFLKFQEMQYLGEQARIREEVKKA